ncbi:MAG: glycosyltransferase family 4 protein [Bacteroidota bacterium]
MIIAINCIYFTPKGGGITEYIYNLVKEIFQLEHSHKFIIYVTNDGKEKIKKITGNKAIIKEFPYSEHQKYKRSLFQQAYWSKEEKKEKFDLFHSPFFHAPKFKKAKTILTVHDLRFLNYPGSYKRTRLFYLKYAVKKSVKQANRIIAISQFTKQELLKYYPIDQSKITVIHEAVNQEGFVLKDESKSKIINGVQLYNNNFFLSVGHLEPRKNYINLIQSHKLLPQSIRNKYQLVVVGKKNHDYKKILENIEHTEGLVYLDFISRNDLIWLYANCKLHIFPSFYEGFGFPSLEAGLFGKPTLAANQSSIPEIAGSGALYFNPFSVEEIQECILKVVSDSALYDQLSTNAKSNIKRFSWKENATKTLNVYNTFE